MKQKNIAVSAAVLLLLCSFTARADEPELQEKISRLEKRLNELETQRNSNVTDIVNPLSQNNAFNPYMGVVLSGSYNYYSRDEKNITGFQTGEEGMLSDKGFSLGESEVNLGASVDDKFLANFTASVVNEDGEDKIELEEAYVQTTGLPYGITVTAGRLKPVFGYLNEKHAHTDDFADRPLPYRVFLNNSYKDDGVQFSIVLPTDFYSEAGGGLYKGGFFPAAAEGVGNGAANAYLKFGGDINPEQSWLAGFSYLYAKSNGEGRETDDVIFKGKENIYGLSFKYSYAPEGNNRETEFSVSGEYLLRDEKGKYSVDKGDFFQNNTNSSGWYIQSAYKFLTNWKVAYRYARMHADNEVNPNFSGINSGSGEHNPEIHSAMLEWNNSEFSKIRFQYNYDKSTGKGDNQFILQYIMSFGAHGAHSY